MISFIIFIFGAIIGSFLNVCIYRIPIEKSIVRPRSFCPSCKQMIKWFDNIPLISFLILRGKCRNCKTKISLRYFIVEFITALSGIMLLHFFSLTPQFFVYWILICALIIVVFVDIERMEIPDVISLPGILAGLVLSTFISGESIAFSGIALRDSLIGIFAGGGSLYLMGFFGEMAFREKAKAAGGAVGGGDIKLMAMIGAFIGWKLVLLTFFLAPFFGAVIGIYTLLKKKQEIIPYGPYLSIAAIVSLLYGERILKFLFPYY